MLKLYNCILFFIRVYIYKLKKFFLRCLFRY